MLWLIDCSVRNNTPPSNLRQERTTSQRAAATTLSSRRTRRSGGLSNEVTEDVKLDSDGLVEEADSTKPGKKSFSSQRTNQSISAKATVQGVVIPSPTSIIPSRRGRSIPTSQSPSLDGSTLSSLRGQSSGYDTPGTSMAVTPAESLGTRGSLTEISRNAVIRPIEQSTQTGIHSKRKHEDILGDALLAQALQEEEYREEVPTGSLAKRRRTVAVEDTEDENLGLSDVDDVDPLGASHQSAKARKSGGRLSLPTRAARESAMKSMKNEVPRDITDTDSDDSELSEYSSVEDLEDFDGSDTYDENMSVFGSTAPGEADGATATEASNRSAAASTVRRRGRRMAPSAAASMDRSPRNRLPYASRVSTLHPLDHGLQQLKHFRPSASVGNLKLLIPKLKPCGIP